MKETIILLAPFFWALKNDVLGFSYSFYKKLIFYVLTSSLFIFLITKLLNMGMYRLQSLSYDVFQILLGKGYSLIFLIIVFVQILNGIVISLNTYYHSKDLEILFVSPVNRTSLFLSKLIETHVKASWMLIIFGLPLLISVGSLYKADLSYYVYALVLFIAFSMILVNIGTGLTIFISSFFQAGRIRRTMITAGVIATVLLLTLLRVLRPERFVNPEFFANLTLFLSELKTPSFILLPNRWLSQAPDGADAAALRLGRARGDVGDLQRPRPRFADREMVSVMMGSGETTFYVLAVYFGSVGISRIRQAVPAGVIADVVSIVVSVWVVQAVF